MLLACQRQADRGGESLLADGRTVHAELSTRWHEAAVMLSRPRTAFFGAGDGHCTQVFTVHPGGRVTLRLRQDELARWSPLAAPHLPCLGEAIARHQFRLALAPGQGYLLDNHRWLHARTQFTGDRCYLRALGELRSALVRGFAVSPAAALVPVTSEAA